MIQYLLVPLAQQTPGMTPYEFALALSDRWLPFLFVLAGLIGTYLKLRSVEKGINGRMSQLIDATAHAAKAEGKVEGLKEAPATPPPHVEVQVQLPPPDAVPGGKRRTDPPVPPPDADPTSHLP